MFKLKSETQFEKQPETESKGLKNTNVLTLLYTKYVNFMHTKYVNFIHINYLHSRFNFLKYVFISLVLLQKNYHFTPTQLLATLGSPLGEEVTLMVVNETMGADWLAT